MKLSSFKPSHWKNGIWNRMVMYSCPFLSDESFLKLKFKHCVGYSLNLYNPQTFSEKIQWLKLYNRRPEFTIMVDKFEAKKYVAGIIGEEYIIPTLQIYSSMEEIDFDTLPRQFVLKCTHNSGCGMYICRDKLAMDEVKVRKSLRKGLREDYFIKTREWPYKNVPRRIIAEQYMSDIGLDLVDYKFFCFGGKAEYCQVITNRSTNETIDFYDREWNHLPFIGLMSTAQNAPTAQKAPIKYNQMVAIADKLAERINTPFVRIDLYNFSGKIYFGEITFFPLSGMGVFTPLEWNLKLGNMLYLPIQ